jgi:thioredoxin 1
MSSELVKHVSEASFEQDVLKSSQPVLVDFWAEWCGPCKAFAPVLDDAAKAYEGRVTMAKVDVDSSPETAGRYGVRSIPTLILYKDGKPLAQKIGMLSRSQLAQFLDSNLQHG